MVLFDDDDDDGDDDKFGEYEEFDCEDEILSNDEADDIERGSPGESILITGGETHPELISWLDCGRAISESSSESLKVRSITSILGFFVGDTGGESPESETVKELR